MQLSIFDLPIAEVIEPEDITVPGLGGGPAVQHDTEFMDTLLSNSMIAGITERDLKHDIYKATWVALAPLETPEFDELGPEMAENLGFQALSALNNYLHDRDTFLQWDGEQWLVGIRGCVTDTSEHALVNQVSVALFATADRLFELVRNANKIVDQGR